VARRDSSGNVFYYMQDDLGTTDGMVEIPPGDTSATVCYDADFYPYGGEKVYTNTCPQNYKFEGKERDTETNNDDFGARYYSSVYGRWLSPDWSAIPAPVPYANLSNPQTLNLYAMVADNPETFADLDGHGDCQDHGDSCESKKDPDFTGDALGNYNYQRSQSSSQQSSSQPNSGNATDQNTGQSAQNGTKTTLTLGGTKVDVTLSAAQTEAGGNGVVIEANPQGCADCRWAQTVTRTGTAPLATQTDRALPNQPLSPSGDRPNQLWDFPSTQKGGSATFTAVSTLGVADQVNKSFKVLGSMTWGYKVDKSGNITVIGPRAATRVEQARSTAVLKRDSPTWTIGP
jgi:RHS repeat-associated protein